MTCYDKAVSLLAVREHTEKELRAKLRAKGYAEEEVSSAVERLLREDYLSEERFASSFVRSRLRKSPEGKGIIMQRLLEKGSPRPVAASAVSSAWEDGLYAEPLIACARRLVAKKGEESAKALLLKKGFSYSEVSQALEAAGSEREALDIE